MTISMRSPHAHLVRSTLTLTTLMIAAALLTVAAASPAPGLVPLRAGAERAAPEITILESNDQIVRLVFELPAVQLDRIDLAGEDSQLVGFERGEAMGAIGAPALPEFTRLIEMPARVGAALRVVATEEQVLTDVRLLPMQDLDGDTFALDEALYARDTLLGGEAAAIGAPALMRDLRAIPVTFRPVRYNPARRELHVLTRIELEVVFAGLDPRNAEQPRVLPRSSDIEQLYRASVLNYAPREADPGRGETAASLGMWVLIARDDSSVLSRLQPLVDWRRRMGFEVRVATTTETGSTSTAIRNWLINAYNTWPNPPEYITLAGDATGGYSIPTFYESVSGYGGEGDHPYSLLAGTDDVPEAFVGRLSFGETSPLTQLETIVAKIIDYEKTPYVGDTAWYKSACLVGDPASGLTCIQIQQWLKERLRVPYAYTRVDTIFGSPFVSRIRNSVNAGLSYFGYRGMGGMSGWTYGDIYALTNTHRLPFCLNLTCGTGSFASGSVSINEAWLRAGTPTNPIGGIGSIATATNGTHTRYNNCYYGGVAYGFFWEELYRLGVAQARGKLEMVLNYGAWEPAKVTAWCYWNTLMGDPATELRTGVPRQLVVTYPATVPLGATVVTVTVAEAGGGPVADAWVYLYQADAIGVGGRTDADGAIELPLDASALGTVLVTVTGHDLYPHAGSFTIAQAADFVAFDGITIDDDYIAPSIGNGDGFANPGERIVPRITLANRGTDTAAGVTLTAHCVDRYVEVANAGPIAYGDMAPGATAEPLADLIFDIAPDAPNGHTVTLELEIASGAFTWTALTTMAIVAPQMSEASITLTGCGSRLDPGESCTLAITIRNDGTLTALGPIQARLISDSYSVIVTDATAVFPNSIGPGGSGTNSSDTFALSAPSDAIPGLLAHLQLALAFSDGVRDTVEFTMPVGAADAADPTGPDAYGYIAYDNTDTGYSEKPTYSWIDLPGVGQLVGLTDYGEAQDDVVTLALPFPFQYYGETYTRVSICSNGWIAMGSTYTTQYRNWYLPCADAPPNQIAPFWDDIYQTSSGKVYYWFDAANHRYVVAWDNVRMLGEYGNYAESFELILYDPSYYPTYTGDGVIVFQYETVNNNDTVQEYCTVGIQDREHTRGLTYNYFNTPAPTAAPLQAGRAIKITTAGPGASSAHSGAMSAAPLALTLDSWPNPAASSTTLRFALGRAQPISLRIYDAGGRLVQTLLRGPVAAGSHTIAWPGTDAQGNPVPAGVYFYRLDGDGASATRKLMWLR
jgi:hypothetical protein